MGERSDRGEQVHSREFCGWRRCLGSWCGHKCFWSPDKRRYCYCDKCLLEKDKAQDGDGKMRVYRMK